MTHPLICNQDRSQYGHGDVMKQEVLSNQCRDDDRCGKAALEADRRWLPWTSPLAEKKREADAKALAAKQAKAKALAAKKKAAAAKKKARR